MTAKRKRKTELPVVAILVVIGINAYALNKLVMIARSWKTNLLPGSVSTELMQLAIILGINCVALIYLLCRK